MAVAHELLDRFRSLPRQVHLSSLSGGHHAPLLAEDEELFAGVLVRCRDVPWILEAEPPERWASNSRGRPWWLAVGTPAIKCEDSPRGVAGLYRTTHTW